MPIFWKFARVSPQGGSTTDGSSIVELSRLQAGGIQLDSTRFNQIPQIELLVDWTGTSAKILPRVSEASSGEAFGSGFMIMLVLSAQTWVNPPASNGVWW